MYAGDSSPGPAAYTLVQPLSFGSRAPSHSLGARKAAPKGTFAGSVGGSLLTPGPGAYVGAGVPSRKQLKAHADAVAAAKAAAAEANKETADAAAGAGDGKDAPADGAAAKPDGEAAEGDAAAEGGGKSKAKATELPAAPGPLPTRVVPVVPGFAFSRAPVRVNALREKSKRPYDGPASVREQMGSESPGPAAHNSQRAYDAPTLWPEPGVRIAGTVVCRALW